MPSRLAQLGSLIGTGIGKGIERGSSAKLEEQRKLALQQLLAEQQQRQGLSQLGGKLDFLGGLDPSQLNLAQRSALGIKDPARQSNPLQEALAAIILSLNPSGGNSFSSPSQGSSQPGAPKAFAEELVDEQGNKFFRDSLGNLFDSEGNPL